MNPNNLQPVQEAAQTQVEEQVSDNSAAQDSYSWDASEYIYHEKSAGWYLALWLIAAILCGILGFLQQWLSIAVVVVMAIAIMVYTRKHPRTLQYTLDSDGIIIEHKELPYTNFRSFSILQDMAWYSIDLEPAKRFVPRLTLICENDDVEKIEQILSSHLPRADRELDFIERASRYLRF